MSVYSPVYHAMVSSPTPPSPAAEANAPKDEGFFHHLLDVVNPLQHLPIIGTIYRAVTGEHIGIVEKIAGDTLYGGLWGAVSSIADVAFEGVTGNNMEDTVLAWFKSDSSTAVAGAGLRAPSIVAAQSLPSSELPSLPQDGQVAAATTETFEGTPGKSMQDTGLAGLKGDSSTAVASAKVTAPSIAATQSLPSSELPSLRKVGPIAAATTASFEGATGKSMQDTGFSWLKTDSSTAVASAKVTAPSIVATKSLPSPALPSLLEDGQVGAATQRSDVDALSAALTAKGVSSDIASRALYAYRRSMGLSTPVLASVN